jgi:hypothetical protein
MNRFAAILLLAFTAIAAPARAETVNCANITTLPATISSAGVYCLKQDLATSIESGAALNIASNNVILDCNGYRLGGLAAGDHTLADSSRVRIVGNNLSGSAGG